jgi:hypothetical protein
MKIVTEFLGFVSSILHHYVAWGTGSFLVLVLFIVEKLCNWKVPKSIYLAFFSVGLLISCFQAWQDQYRENQSSRSVGSLVFQYLDGSLIVDQANKNGEGDLQLELVFLNIRDRLIRYNMNRFVLSVGSISAPYNFLNKGGYAYPSVRTVFLSPRFRIPLKQPITGKLEYEVSYTVEGSRAIHHASKGLAFDCWLPDDKSKPVTIKFVITNEHED